MRGTRCLVVTVIVALLALGACGTSLAKGKRHRANWPTYHANLARTGVDTSSPQLGQLSRAWTAQLDGQVYAEPLVVGSRVYAATENNSVYALNARTGRVGLASQPGYPG